MVTDIGDPAIALLMNHRMVGAPPLQIDMTGEPHVLRLFFARLGMQAAAQRVTHQGAHER
jgi:hypothetical protein